MNLRINEVQNRKTFEECQCKVSKSKEEYRNLIVKVYAIENDDIHIKLAMNK